MLTTVLALPSYALTTWQLCMALISNALGTDAAGRPSALLIHCNPLKSLSLLSEERVCPSPEFR